MMKRISGFTLIELLIVVAIIGILAMIAVPNLMNAQVRAKVARTQCELKVIADALDSYCTEYGSYPPERSDSGNFPGGYHYLTSPIPYLHGLMDDPFTVKYVANRGNDYDTTYEFMVTSLHGKNNDMFNIEAIGPDGIDSFQPTPMYPDHPPTFEFYDATNGLRSYGDILRAGGVYLPRWYREHKGGPYTTGRSWI